MKIRCLIIEDELYAINPLLNWLRRLERKEEFAIRISQKTNLAGILEDLRENPWVPDVILLDIMMPEKQESLNSLEKGGETFLINLRKGEYEESCQLSRTIPVVVLSGYIEIEKFKKKHQENVFKIFSKPADIFQVTDALKDAALKKREEK